MAILTLTIPGVGNYDYDTSTTGIPGQRQDLRAIQSFNILANDTADEWTLYVNNQIFIGRYTTQAQAIGALFGCFIRAGADEVGLAAAMGNQINAGLSVITDDGDNIITQSIQGGEYVGTLSNFNEATFVPTSTVTVGAPTVILNGTPTALNGATSFSGNTPALYFSTNTFTVATAWTGPGILNAIELTPLTVPALSVNVSLPTAVPVVGQPYTASAALTNYDSRIPVKYKWTWFKVVSSTATAVQGPDITTSATNTLLAANLTLDSTTYKAKVEMLYALNDTIITNADAQETSSPSETTFAWIQGPEITLLSQDQYNISPVLNTDYVGTGATFDYAWTREINGITGPFGTNAATQVLSLEGVYESDVTGQNTVNGTPYSGNRDTRNSITITTPVDVTNIKLFLSADPTGTEITAPIAGVQYYAYAYSGTTLLTTSDLTWSAVTPASTFGVSGLLDTTFGTGASTTSPVWVLPSGGPAGSTGVASRQDANVGLAVLFNSTTSMNNFIAAYPNDFAQLVYRDTFNNVDVVTKPGWVWDPQFNNRAYLEVDQWLNWQPFTASDILDQTMDWKQRVIPVGSTGWGPITSTGVKGVSGEFAAAQYTGVSIFDELGLIQINTTDASDIITFFFHTALARDEFKAFTNFTVGGTSFNPSANADWVELNAGTLGFGLQYVDSVVCPAWTDELDSGTTFGYYVGTSTFSTPAQLMTWTLGGTAGATFDGTAVISGESGTAFLHNGTSGLQVYTGPRLPNGNEANNFGAVNWWFQEYTVGNYLSSGTQCSWYWQSLDVRTTNSRLGTTIQRAPAYTSVQPSYNNTGGGNTSNIVVGPNFAGWEGGDVVNFEIRDNNYASKRLLSFGYDGTTGYQPHTTIGGDAMWNFRGTSSVAPNSPLGKCTFYDSSEGARDGKMQWLIETAQALELWDRDTNTVIPCTHTSDGTGTTILNLFFTANALISGNRYELRYV